MLFNSISFLLFLSIVFGIYWLSPRRAIWQNIILLTASLAFYCFWDWRFSFLFVASIVWTYFIALRVEKGSRTWLISGICGLVVVLCVCKYANFFLGSLGALIGMPFSPLKLILPLGISFYTFMAVGYLLDVFWKKVPAERNFISCGIFLMFFPQIAAGPIGRATQMLPQYDKSRVFDCDKALHGVTLICYGLFKKMAVADTLALYVNKIWIAPELYSSVTLIMAAVFYSVEIYCDFSGYSDIARGVGKLFGIDLMLNFDRPYLSRSFGEFWKRWHISLSSWFKDYLYIPLGGNRVSSSRTIINLWIVMLISGLWHGAAWGFVLWGGLYAVYMTLGRFSRPLTTFMPKWLNVIFLNVGVLFAWIFFRGGEIAPVMVYIRSLVTNGLPHAMAQICGGQHWMCLVVILLLFVCLALSYLAPRDCLFKTRRAHFLFQLSCILVVVMFGTDANSSFIYFQF